MLSSKNSDSKHFNYENNQICKTEGTNEITNNFRK
jgi:hypothetical protein